MAAEAAVVFAPEVIKMRAGREQVQGEWRFTLTISASEALLKDAQDLYAKTGFKECSTRDAFDSPPSIGKRVFMDAGKLHVRLPGAWHYLVPDYLLRLCLAALAARGLAPAPAEPAALALGAAGPQAATEAVLRELWHRVVQPGGLRSLWLPRAPPARPAGATPAGMAALRVLADGVMTDFKVPEDMWATVQRRWPDVCRDMIAEFGNNGSSKTCNAILLAVFISAAHHCGYELVAPQEVAEQACRQHGSADLGATLQPLSLDAELVFLPKAVLSQHGLGTATTSIAVLKIRKDGVVADFTAAQELRDAAEQYWLGMRPAIAEEWQRTHQRRPLAELIVAACCSAAEQCSYQFVAPKDSADQMAALRDQGAEVNQDFQLPWEEAVDDTLTLVFFAQANLTSEHRCLVEVRQMEEYCPPGYATLEMKQNGLVTRFDAANELKSVLEEAHPWLGGDHFTMLKDIPVDFVHEVHEVVLSSITSLGYIRVTAPVGPTAGTYRFYRSSRPTLPQSQEPAALVEQAMAALRAEFTAKMGEQAEEQQARLTAESARHAEEQRSFRHELRQAEEQQARLTAESARHAEEQRSFRHELRQAEEQQARLSAESARHAEEQRSLRDELHQASDARDELSAKVRETQHNGSEALEALRAELMQALNEHQEELRVQAEQIQAEVQAKVEESARHAEEQRTLRSGLQEALEVQRSSHEALRAELMEAVREQQEDAREKREVGMEALEDLRSQVNVLVTGRREHDEEVAALKAKLLAAEQRSAEAKDKPCFRIYDVDGGTAGAAKHIRIECPGAEVDDITIEDLCNGVHVHIAVSTNLPTEFDKEFVFDRRKDGFFELRQDECWYENGVLLLVLRGTLPKRMKLKQGGPPSAQRASLATVLEEVQCSQGEGNGQTPMYYDIASVHFEGSHDADSRSSWMPVDVDARGSAWPQSEQDAMSIGKESLGEASQQSSWVIPNDAASSRPGASQAPSSHGSGAASLATVRSVASAPARGTAPRCFLPGTAFRREETGEYVRAAELMRAGGDKLVGPGGSQVLVSSAIKHAAVERDLVSLRLRGVSAAFVVTADHQLLARGPKDKPVARSAGEFARGMFLFDGTDFHHVEQAKLFKHTCQVVELSFEGDAAALAWVVPRRSRSSGARVPVAVLGKEPTLGDHGVFTQRTFLDVPSSAPTASAGARSRSAGSRPALGSLWSVGSQGHDDKQPGQCDVCSRHHFYLKSLSGPNPGNAKPCPEGASCRKCHAPHPEYSGEGRSA